MDNCSTEIFTGHHIRLADIRGISPIMREIRPHTPFVYQTMYIEIYLCDNVTIRHNVIKLQTFNGMDMEENQAKQWEQAHYKTTADLTALIEQWNRVTP